MQTKLLMILLVLAGVACTPEDESEATPSPSPIESTPSPSPTEAAAQSVEVYLHSGNDEDCSEVVAVERDVDKASLTTAMEQLLAGPTQEEESEGLGGWFSEDTEGMLISAELDGDVARVDFEDFRDVIPNASTSCGSAMLLAQLDSTAGQFDVSDTLYSIEGEPQTFYEWLQLGTPEV
ncbi:MAG: GerMN domain-containing protein [Actinobacteria bacterium]|nr:GerMN domain-containing protein [Actinomycetota bacterium]